MQSMCISVGTYVESKKEGADPRRTSMYPPRTSVNDPDPHRPRRRTSVVTCAEASVNASDALYAPRFPKLLFHGFAD